MTRLEGGAEKAKKRFNMKCIPPSCFSSKLPSFVFIPTYFTLCKFAFFTTYFVFVPPRSLSCGFDQDGTGSAVQTQMSPRINQIFSFPAEMPLQVVHFKVLTMGKVVIEKLD